MASTMSTIAARPAWLEEPVIGGLLRTADGVMFAAAGLLAHPTFYRALLPDFWPEFYWPESLLLLIGLLMVLQVFAAAGLYSPEAAAGPLPILRILVGFAIAASTVVLAATFVRLNSPVSSLWLGAWLGTAGAGIVAGRWTVARLIRRWSRTGRMVRNIVVVGDFELACELAERMKAADDPSVRLLGLFHDGQKDSNRQATCPVLGIAKDLVAFVRATPIDEVIVALPWHADDRLSDWLAWLRNVPSDVLVCPPVSGRTTAKSGLQVLGGRPLIKIAERPLSGWSYIIKSVEDRVLGAILLVLVAPLMIVIAALIRMDSPGPVLFRQKRHGFNNSIIEVPKFRTMYVETCQEGTGAIVQATRDDPRVTRVGRWLRRTSLDELPQLFNVLGGTMSLVGPRPHAVAHNEQFADVINAYLGRHRVKPGITGWAQVNGFRGETDTIEKMERRVQHDLFYIENWSLLLDVVILVRTIGAFPFQRNAY